MSITINGSTGISGVDGSSTTPAFQGTDTNTGLFYGTDIVGISTGGSERVRVDANGNVGIGNTSPSAKLQANSTYATTWNTNDSTAAGYTPQSNELAIINNQNATTNSWAGIFFQGGQASTNTQLHTARIACLNDGTTYGGALAFATRDASTANSVERMRIDSSGDVFIACTSNPTSSSTGNGGFYYAATSYLSISANNQACVYVNRIAGDGTLVTFRESGTTEGSISVSGTTVSYNGGHLSRWSQWQNETGKPNVYRGTVLESTNDMCEWEKDGEPLPNEQATKTIVSTTLASKVVAGVFDRYDEDDETNPYDFYVAQSGDFVIRIAQGVTVQNGDLLESAGDGTAKPQADDICRSSTVAKVTSNYVSATYEDGSYCVPCILMIG